MSRLDVRLERLGAVGDGGFVGEVAGGLLELDLARGRDGGLKPPPGSARPYSPSPSSSHSTGPAPAMVRMLTPVLWS